MAERITVVQVGVQGPPGTGLGSHEDQSSTLTHVRQVTSSTRPSSPIEGQVIYETDTDKYMVWNGSAWVKWVAHQKAISVRATKSGNQSIPHAAFTAVTFTVESYDTDGIHDNSTNTSRLTFPRAGIWRFGFSGSFALNGTGVRAVKAKKNGAATGVLAGNLVPSSGSIEADLSITGEALFAAADYIEFEVYQNSGGALNLLAGASGSTPECNAWATFVGNET